MWHFVDRELAHMSGIRVYARLGYVEAVTVIPTATPHAPGSRPEPRTRLPEFDVVRALVLVGVFISITLELCGIRSLSFAVGSYLPIATTAPIFVGGLVRAFVERKMGAAEESEVGAGTLFSSGLIAGGSLCGILYAVLVGTGNIAMPQALGPCSAAK